MGTFSGSYWAEHALQTLFTFFRNVKKFLSSRRAIIMNFYNIMWKISCLASGSRIGSGYFRQQNVYDNLIKIIFILSLHPWPKVDSPVIFEDLTLFGQINLESVFLMSISERLRSSWNSLIPFKDRLSPMGKTLTCHCNQFEGLWHKILWWLLTNSSHRHWRLICY